jgi:hypothetical protein
MEEHFQVDTILGKVQNIQSAKGIDAQCDVVSKRMKEKKKLKVQIMSLVYGNY